MAIRVSGLILFGVLAIAKPAFPCQDMAADQATGNPGQIEKLPAGTAATQPGNQDENADLNRIPNATQTEGVPVPAGPSLNRANQRIYIENAFTGSIQRSDLLVPSPPPSSPTWQERLFLDVRKQWNPHERVSLILSDRVNIRAEDDLPSFSHENAINDFREGYVSLEPKDRLYVDAGRINLKSGAAVGYNPTDFLKTRAVVEPLSADPTVLREDRLGALMLRGQRIWQGSALMIAFVPRFYRPTPIYSNIDLRSFDPSFDRTNAQTRVLLKANADISKDFSPEVLIIRDGSTTRLGLNVTASLKQSTVLYAEWAGGKQRSLIDRAISYGRETGTLSADTPDPIPTDTRLHFQNSLSAGLSYTTASKITFNLEYHFDEAAFSGLDWEHWFDAGIGLPSSSSLARELWYIRGYALDQQEPTTQHSMFLRADCANAFVRNLELTGFINSDVHDGSSLVQASADYYLSNAWTIGIQGSRNFGGRHTDFGSLPQTSSALIKIARYF